MELDGLITFESSYQALRAERALQRAGVAGRLVPAPRDLSPTCVVSLRFPWPEASRITLLLSEQKVEIDRCCCYPEAAKRPAGWANLY